eukprot:128442-Pyramimonas_sp.AAC.1
MWPGNGDLGMDSGGFLRILKDSSGFLGLTLVSGFVRIPPRPPWGVKMLSLLSPPEADQQRLLGTDHNKTHD